MDILTSLQSIGFDWRLALAHLVNFLIVLALLRYFVFGPLRKRLAERKQVIEKGVADARRAEAERYKAKEKREEIIAAAKAEKREIITAAHEEAEAMIAHGRDEAISEADAIIHDAHKQIAEDRIRMQKELESKVGDLAVVIAEKIMEREVTDTDHQKLVKNVVNSASNV